MNFARTLAAPAAAILFASLAGCEDTPVWFPGYDVVPVDASDVGDGSADGTDFDADDDTDDDTARPDTDDDTVEPDTGAPDTADARDEPLDTADSTPDTSGACGSFVVECRGVERDEEYASDISVPTFWEVDCRITWSEAPTVSDYDITWLMTARPEGSSGGVEPDHDLAIGFVDLAGAYTIEAAVSSGEGCLSSAAATVTAENGDGLVVTLVWDTPGDTTRDVGLGAGSDADLRLLNTEGCWGSNPWDLNYANKTPDWGGESRPEMRVDDADGWGPEEIAWATPVSGTYVVGVHYYDDQGYGPSTATVRISVSGVEVFQAGPHELEAPHDWWIVGSYHHPSGEVVAIDEVYSLSSGVFPPCE